MTTEDLVMKLSILFEKACCEFVPPTGDIVPIPTGRETDYEKLTNYLRDAFATSHKIYILRKNMENE